MKRKYAEIVCGDCGGPAKAPNAATKRCRSCALGRAARWHDGRAATCECGAEYIAWHGRADRVCGRCYIARAPEGGRESVPGHCKVCDQDAVVFTADLAICFPCLTAPANFKVLKRDIGRKIKRMARPT